MLLSVVTPSYQSARWLPLCHASVADQGIPVEHLVQDAGSTDGTADWLRQHPEVRAVVEADAGMYDAINKGLRRAQGDLLAYLNCDEQFLPGALRQVLEFFAAHPEVDILFGDALVVDDAGQYLCHRCALTPRAPHTAVAGTLATLTCATFFRRELLSRHGLYFDPAWKAVGDAEWLGRVVGSGVRMATLRAFTSAFAQTGTNLGQSAAGREEARRFRRKAPRIWRWARPAIVLQHRLRRWRAGHYRPLPPFTYAVYTRQSQGARVTRAAAHPTYRWTQAQTPPTP